MCHRSNIPPRGRLMYYHRRFSEDGKCEIICIGCFRTLGIANSIVAAKEIEAHHVCACAANRNHQMPAGQLSGNGPATGRPTAPLNFAKPSFGTLAMAQKLSLPFMIAAVGLLIYALPTLLEWIAFHHVNPWFAVIFPGDLTGCVFLAVVFKMPRTGALLYVLLTAFETFLYSSHLVSAEALIWIVDLAPTLMVVGAIARLRSGPPQPGPTLA